MDIDQRLCALVFLFLGAGREEHLLWSTQLMGVENENQARKDLILTKGVLFMLHL